jgi:hypothetical protein
MLTRLNFAVICATAMSFVFPAFSYGEQVPKSYLEQTETVLRNNPTLSTGFTTPAKATVRVVNPANGVLELEFHSDEQGIKGTITVVGPTTIIAKESVLGALVDALINLGKDLLTAFPTGGGIEGVGQKCVNVNVTGSNNTVNVVANGNVCQ